MELQQLPTQTQCCLSAAGHINIDTCWSLKQVQPCSFFTRDWAGMSNEHRRRHRSLCKNDVVRSQASSPVCNLMVQLSVITWRLWLFDEWCCDSAAIPTRLAPRTLQHYRPSLSCFSFWPLVSQQQHVRKHCAGANERLKIAKTSSLSPPYSQTLVQPGARAKRCEADPFAWRCSGSQKSLDTNWHYFLHDLLFLLLPSAHASTSWKNEFSITNSIERGVFLWP